MRQSGNGGVAAVRGEGDEPTVKSALLLSVSFNPLALRTAHVVALMEGVGDVSEQLVVGPKPTRSTNAFCGLQGVATPSALRATLPFVPLRSNTARRNRCPA
jgi:hypothetical protein